MKFRGIWLPLLAAALLAPGAVRAQEDEEDRRPGMIGTVMPACRSAIPSSVEKTARRVTPCCINVRDVSIAP